MHFVKYLTTTLESVCYRQFRTQFSTIVNALSHKIYSFISVPKMKTEHHAWQAITWWPAKTFFGKSIIAILIKNVRLETFYGLTLNISSSFQSAVKNVFIWKCAKQWTERARKQLYKTTDRVMGTKKRNHFEHSV